MEILRPGRVPDDRYEGECTRCRCYLLATPREVKDLGDPREPGCYVPCPTPGCGRNIAVRPRGRPAETPKGEPSHILVRPLPGKTAAETADVVRRVIEATREREGK